MNDEHTTVIESPIKPDFHFDARRDAGVDFVRCTAPIQIDLAQTPPTVRIAFITSTRPTSR